MGSKKTPPTIMLVNDDPALTQLISTVLKEEGYRVLACLGVEESIARLQSEDVVDLIITDLHMPKIDGWQFCRMLRSREHAEFNQSPILVVSSTFSGSDTEDLTKQLGANAFLSAPFEMATLKTYVRELLAGKNPQMPVAVLLVDDDKKELTRLKTAFRNRNYGVHVAATGKEARRLFKKHSPAAVVINYHLSDTQGDMLLAEFKKAGVDAVVVMKTKDLTAELALQFVQQGADAYVCEPFEPSDLVDVCDQVRRKSSLFRVEELLIERTRELRESEKRSRLLLDHIPESILVHDDKGEILHVNEVGARILDEPPEQLVGKNIRECIPPESAVDVKQNVKRVFETGECSFETTYISRNGKRTEVEVHERLIDFEGRQAILSVGRDITMRRKAEDALSRNEEQLRGIFASLYDTFIAVLDGDGRYRSFWSPRELDERYGIKGETFVGKTLFDVFSKEHATERLRVIRRVIESRQSVRDEYRVNYPAGEFWHDITLSPMLSESGEVSAVVAFVRDVTEYKRAQGALWDLSALLETTFDAIPDAIITQDLNRKIVRCNRAGYGFFKMTPGAAIGRQCHHLVGRDRPCACCVRETVLETRQSAQIETYFEEMGLWVDLRIYPVLDDEGRVVKVVEHMRDITERKRAEEAMQGAERFLTSVFTSIQDGISVLDNDLRIVRVNPTMERWYPHALPLVGRKCYEAFHQRDEKCPNCPSARTLETSKSAYQCVPKVSADGNAVGWLEVYAFPLLDIGSGRMNGVIEYVRDITGRREAESERERLAAAVNQAAEATLITGTSGKIEYVNPAFEQITGFSAHEVIGKTPAILKSGEHDRAFYEDLWKTIRAGRVWRGHFVNKRKDGTLYEEDATIAPVRGSGGEIMNYVAVKRDVTEEVELGNQLRQAQKMQAIGNLAGGVAHDFNNILTGILGYSSMLKARMSPGDDMFAAAETIEKAARRAAGLTQQLLRFARKGKRENVPVDVHATIEEVVTLLSRTIVKTIKIDNDFRADNPWVFGDPDQTQQVILNLAVNARDAMPNGGRLCFATETMDMDDDFCGRCGLDKPGQYLVVSVTDTGSGIPKDVQERVFEPFFTTKDKGKGTGMGLAMVYSNIKDHGGTVTVYSEVGLGTTFRIYLPSVVPPEKEEAAPDTALATDLSGTGRILVVDDEAIIRDVAARILEDLGYEVVTVTDGREAVDYYREHGPEVDLVIIDMVMPNLAGPECFKELKALDPSVKAVLSSGYGLDDTARELMNDGLLGVAQKPYQANQLAEVVAAVMKS